MYGITPQLISSRLNGLLLSSDSRPSVSDVEEIIAEQTARVHGRLRSKGMSVPVTDPSDSLVVKRLVVQLVTAEIEALRNRSYTSFALEAWQAGQAELDALVERPGNLPQSQDTAPGSPDVPGQSHERVPRSTLWYLVQGGGL